MKTQLLLDAIAEAENTTVEQQELTERIFFQAQRYGIPPEQFIQQISQANQLGAVFADVRRGKALGTVVDRANVTDTTGATVDTAELFGTKKDDDAEARTPRRRPPRTRPPSSRTTRGDSKPQGSRISAFSEEGRHRASGAAPFR